MRAEEFAKLLQARPSGTGKWIALCPGHPDRKPSLHIAQGSKGVLLRCWSAGCTAMQITAAMGIKLADLFDGPPASPEQIAELQQQRRATASFQRVTRQLDRESRHDLFRLERLRDSLGARLLRRPNDAELARLFHEVCDRIAEDTPKVWPQPEDGPNRIEPTPETPGWIAAALREIAQSFNQKKETSSSKLAA